MYYLCTIIAVVAQLVEHWLPKPRVAGSSPVYRSNRKARTCNPSIRKSDAKQRGCEPRYRSNRKARTCDPSIRKSDAKQRGCEPLLPLK